jgi:hypothetical protein
MYAKDVGENLMSFASAASRHPDSARELPRFVSEVDACSRRMRLANGWRKSSVRKTKRTLMFLEEDDLLREGPAAVAECVQQFMLVKELLTAPMLGTS